ncbi:MULTISPECIES: hypothetical protein [Lysinibacillus]|uniref:hypothetical protein n=1 Tax=Lysinibacillus TaxID=400634 RepID=UPI0034E1F204
MKNEENKTNQYLPSINYDDTTNCEHDIESDIVVGNSPCPCCEFITIPNNGDALAIKTQMKKLPWKNCNEISKFIHTYPKDSEVIEQLLSNLSNCAHFFKRNASF